MPRAAVEVLCGDCREIVPTLGQFPFVFADPPFNIGHPYAGYHDRRADFEAFTGEWVEACWEACCGILALHGPDDLAEAYLIHARRLGMKRVAWVNWHYRFGQCGWSNWIDARCHCLIFSKGPRWTWNPEAVAVESDRVGYGDRRVGDTERGGRRPPGTVWGVPSDGAHWGRVTGNSRERRAGHPNQLPERYLERLLLAYTDPGDRVLDPFAGSGTTAVVAAALGRPCWTIDVCPEGCASVAARVAAGAVRIPEDRGQHRHKCRTSSAILRNQFGNSAEPGCSPKRVS